MADIAELRRKQRELEAKVKRAGRLIGRGESERERKARASRSASEEIRDIQTAVDAALGKIDRKRRAAGEASFRVFCETYFAPLFPLAWSPDHLRIIDRIETTVKKGGLFAMALPRGSGKTTLCEIACIWAVLIGARSFVVLIGSDEASAIESLNSIKTELEINALLAQDFPREVLPIQLLEGISHRARGQLYHGERTHIGWLAKEVIFPSLPGSAAGGSIIKVAGLTGRIRGLKHKRADGTAARPQLVILDDPQTDESARSPSQCATREAIITGTVLGLAGPDVTISAVMPCTVISPGDLADSLLDRDKHPAWKGIRTKLVVSFPSDTAAWDEYHKIRDASFREGGDGAAATEYYRQHRTEMDAGAEISWPQRKEPGELSAIQNAMNILRDRGEHAFYAEYQNQPLVPDEFADMLSPDAIARKLSGYDRRIVPKGCHLVTAFVDVHDRLLYWAVCAWEESFTGYLIDYGTYPEVRRPYFTLREVKTSLYAVASRKTQGTIEGVEGAIHAGLTALLTRILRREWQREGGGVLSIERCLVDAGYKPDPIRLAIRSGGFGGVVMPSKGIAITAARKAFSEYRRNRGDRLGHFWRIPWPGGTQELRAVHIDANYWKTFVQERLATALGDRGCLSLFKGADHRMIADHLTAEYPIQTEGRGRVVTEWQQRADHPDNHWLDCIAGCCVAASLQGVKLFDPRKGSKPAGKKIKMSELQQKRRAKR